MRVVFMGTPDFAVPTLRALVAAGHEVRRVISQPDRKRDRGRQLQAPPVAEAAQELGLDLRQPRAVRTGGLRDALAELAPDVLVVVAYGRLLPADVLAVPRYGAVNVHASLLPRWRGAAPIQWAIVAGDRYSGVCTQRMEEGLDTGDIYLEKPVEIAPRETSATLHDRLAPLGAELAVETLARLPDLKPRPQDPEGVSIARRIQKSDARMDWMKSAGELDRQLRGFTPWPGGYVDTVSGDRLKILEARPLEGEAEPGIVAATQPLVVGCGEGMLELVRVQKPGRRACAGPAYAHGAHLQLGRPL